MTNFSSFIPKCVLSSQIRNILGRPKHMKLLFQPTFSTFSRMEFSIFIRFRMQIWAKLARNVQRKVTWMRKISLEGDQNATMNMATWLESISMLRAKYKFFKIVSKMCAQTKLTWWHVCNIMQFSPFRTTRSNVKRVERAPEDATQNIQSTKQSATWFRQEWKSGALKCRIKGERKFVHHNGDPDEHYMGFCGFMLYNVLLNGYFIENWKEEKIFEFTYTIFSSANNFRGCNT